MEYKKTNLPIVDFQHKEIVSLFEQIRRAVEKGDSNLRQTLRDLFRRLSSLMQRHFVTEEEYMRMIDYKGFAGHKKMHDEFLTKITYFEREFENEESIVHNSVLRFLEYWMVEHINKMDQSWARAWHEDDSPHEEAN